MGVPLSTLVILMGIRHELGKAIDAADYAMPEGIERNEVSKIQDGKFGNVPIGYATAFDDLISLRDSLDERIAAMRGLDES